MAVPAPATAFYVCLQDGRNWGGVEFPDGFVCVYTPGEPSGICTIATSIADLLANRALDHPLHGAYIERY